MTADRHLRVLLVSLRDPHDPMAAHERRCFADAAQIPVEHVTVHAMVDAPLGRGESRRYDAVFFGGSGAYSVLDDVGWIHDGMVALQRVVEERRPAWASCFGFQGLAQALGGRVERDDARTELGATELALTDEGRSDPLVGKLPPRFWAQEGHHDHVVELPPGVVRFATGDVSPEQGFRVDGAPFWASQFHPELDPRTTIQRFLHYQALYHAGSDEQAQATLAKLRAGPESPEVATLLARLVRGDY